MPPPMKRNKIHLLARDGVTLGLSWSTRRFNAHANVSPKKKNRASPSFITTPLCGPRTTAVRRSPAAPSR